MGAFVRLNLRKCVNYKFTINIFLSEKFCIVVILVAENGEF